MKCPPSSAFMAHDARRNLVNKVYKGDLCDVFEEWPLNAPINPNADYPLPPSCQLLSFFIAKGSDRITKDLARKKMEVTGYCSPGNSGIEGKADTEVCYSKADLGLMLERAN